MKVFGVFLVAVLAVGLPYWATPYARLNLPDALIGIGLLAVVLGAAALGLFCGTGFRRALWVMGLAAPLVVALRVVVDVVRDPTSHNLWPVELVIALAVGFGASLIGVLLAMVLGRPLSRMTGRSHRP